MANIELLTRLRRQIAEHPEAHDQKVWAEKTECGTTACAAGWTLILTDRDHWYRHGNTEYIRAWNGFVSDVAGDLLNLDATERSYLFYYALTTVDTLTVIDALIAGESEPFGLPADLGDE
jgi:hypothetical protein